MKVFKFQFYRLPFTYEQEDRFYKEEHVNLYKINWNSDSVNNQISWDFTDPLNPKIRVVGKLIGYKNNVLVEAENDFNYCYVEYGEISSKPMKQYFFTIPIKRLSFNAYEYMLKLDVIMTYWYKFYFKYIDSLYKFDIKRATLNQFNRDGTPSQYGIMAYVNSEFDNVIYDGSYVLKQTLPKIALFNDIDYELSNKVSSYCIFSMTKDNYRLIYNYVDNQSLKDLINGLVVKGGFPTFIFCGVYGGGLLAGTSNIVRTTLFPSLIKRTGRIYEYQLTNNLIHFNKIGSNKETIPGITITPITNLEVAANIQILNNKLNMDNWVWNYFKKDDISKSYMERMKIENWCFYDNIKKEIISLLTPPFWPTKTDSPSIKYSVSLSSDLLTILPTNNTSDINVIYWDMTLPVSYSFPKFEEYMRENKNQIDNARAIGDQAIKLSEWERNTSASGHVEGMIRGGLTGGGTGALIGSMISPGIGTAIGGVVGAIGGALTGGAISGGFNTYGVGNTKIDIAKLERQSIEAKIQDIKNLNPVIRSNSNDYTNQTSTSEFGVFVRYNKINEEMLRTFDNYYNRFGSKYNIRITLYKVLRSKYYWHFVQTENMYKDLDDYFPTYIKKEFSNIFDNGVRLHDRLYNNELNLNIFNRED